MCAGGNTISPILFIQSLLIIRKTATPARGPGDLLAKYSTQNGWKDHNHEVKRSVMLEAEKNWGLKREQTNLI